MSRIMSQKAPRSFAATVRPLVTNEKRLIPASLLAFAAFMASGREMMP